MGRTVRERALLVAAFFSGTAALGDEVVWTRILGLTLGHDAFGVVSALSGFFVGLALGAMISHRIIRRGKDPIPPLVGFELGAASFAALSPAWLVAFAGILDGQPALGWSRWWLSGVALIPGTLCLGAIWPLFVVAQRRFELDRRAHGAVGRLYGAHTVGATFGVLITVHLLLPRLGLDRAIWVIATIGVTAAAMAWSFRERSTDAPAPMGCEAFSPPASSPVDPLGLASRPDRERPIVGTSGDPDPDVLREPWLVVAVLGATGALGLALEVVVVQVASQRLENTIYTFAHLLAVYLLGTAAGSRLHAALAPRWNPHRPATATAAMLLLLAFASIATASLVRMVPALLETLVPAGASPLHHMLAELAIATVIFGPATLVMGMTFAQLTVLTAPHHLAWGYAANALGSAIAPLVCAFGLLPSYGYRDSIFVIAYGYLFVFLGFTWFRRFPTAWQLVPTLAVVVATFFAPASLVLVDEEPGWTTLTQRETLLGLVTVSEKAAPGSTSPERRLRVGAQFRMGGAGAFGERRMGRLPLLLHPSPRDVLFLGVGTGATLSGIIETPAERVDAVELVPEILEQLHWFNATNLSVFEDPRISFHVADARRFVSASTRSYDVIVADLFHPGRDGAAGLFALEHFQRCRTRLGRGGLFAQWLPLHQLDSASLRAIVRTFTDVFEVADAFLGVYNVQTPALVLIGAPDGWSVDLETIRSRLTMPTQRALLLDDPRDWLASHLLDAEGLRQWAGDGPRNTDFRPIVAFRAAASAYEHAHDLGWINLVSLLAVRRGIASERLHDPRAQVWPDLDRFGVALDRYLHGEKLRVDAARQQHPVPVEAVDVYLEAYDAAPEFVPVHGVLLGIAAQSAAHRPRIVEAMQARENR